MAGRDPKYPWNDWFEQLEGGSIVGIRAGRDFTHSPQHMRQQILLEARRRKVTVKTTLRPRAGRIDVKKVQRRHSDPWDYWLDGQQHRLFEVDLRGRSLTTMAQLVRQSGRRRGLLVRTKMERGTLLLQAFPRETDNAAA